MTRINRSGVAALLAIAGSALGPLAAGSSAAVMAPLAAPSSATATHAADRVGGADVHQAQFAGRPNGRSGFGPRGPVARPYYAPRAYGPRPGPRFYGGPRAYGGPAWAYRPWYRRPYYGTIIAGIALGTIVGATAYGLAPRPPRPDLCWYWADEIQSQGYWDYC